MVVFSSKERGRSMATRWPTSKLGAFLAAWVCSTIGGVVCGQQAIANHAIVEHPPVKLGELFTLTTAFDRGGAGERLFSVRLAERLPESGAVQVVAVLDDGGREKIQALPTQSEPASAIATPTVWWIAPAAGKPFGRVDRFRVERCETPAVRPAAGGKARLEEAAQAALRDRMAAGREPLVVDQTAESLVVRRGKSPILRYNRGHIEPPAGVDAKYGRSAFIHPAWTPSGAVATDQFPPDHLHQSGIFLAYTKTVFEGREPNFWDLLGGKGRVRFEALKSLVSGPVFAEFLVEHAHVDLTAAEEKPALRETWTVRVWNIGGPDDGFWVWDITSSVRCASSSPLKLPQYHYGGMAVRGGRAWTANAVQFLTSEGLGRANGNHSRPRWCEMSGPVEAAAAIGAPSPSATAGVALLTHPGNFRFPEPLRIHPSMPYMVYTPSHLGDWSIEPGVPRTSRYRWLVHDGRLPSDSIERVWHAFAW
jgi:hypothetical protein